MGSQTTTESGRAGQMSPQARQVMQLLTGQVQGASDQMGDLGALARGELSVNPQDRALVQQAQEATGQVARSQLEQGMETALRQTEDTAIGRGMEGSSIEAVNNALVGQDFQRQLAQMLGQQQAQSSQQLLNMPFQRAQTQMGANQMLLERLTGASNPVMNYDAIIRKLNQTSTREAPSQLPMQLAQLGARGAAAIATSGGSEAAGGVQTAMQPVQPYQMPTLNEGFQGIG